MMSFVKLTLAGMALTAAGTASAAMVDLSSYVNANVRTYSSGQDYPVGDTTIGGITFNIAAYQGGAGIVQLNSLRLVNIAVNQSAVDTVYLIINSAYGEKNRQSGSLTFNGLSTTGVTRTLTQGLNIRDHFQGSGNNVAVDAYATATYDGGNRFDVYRYDVSALGGNLSSILFSRIGTENANGLPFLAGVTTAFEGRVTAAVPEPTTWAMLIFGFGATGCAMRRRKVRFAPAV